VVSATPDQRARRRDADENLDALLDAAARVLADDPAATMAEIAAASGLGRVTAWRHLGSREQLLALLSERAAVEVRETLERLLGDGPAEPADIGRAVEALVGIGSRYRVLFVAQPGGPLRERRRAAFTPLASAIRRGQRAGTLRGGLAPELAAALTASAAQAALQEAAGGARALKRTTAAARAFAEAGLRATGS
jgi:AcrR family transcriptional regulator